MGSLVHGLARAIAVVAPEEGVHKTPIAGVHCVRYSTTSRPTRDHWRACLAIVAQGVKEVELGREVYRCAEGHYTATPISLPVISRVASATAEKPFLGMLIDLDPVVLSEVTAQTERVVLADAGAPVRALFRGKAGESMLEAAIRAGRPFQTREDALALGPLVVRELLYHLLKGAEGSAIRQFVRSGSTMHRIAQAVHALRSGLSDEIDVPALAKAANMSRSAFFKHFKEITSMSPIQYQKRLRLHEARRLLIDEGETAERSAFRVGYKSASQFSREYSRMFGNSPLRDVMAPAQSQRVTFGARAGAGNGVTVVSGAASAR
ncbi:MAG TPA: AraC family transcriptional regulator [bacterium]|nr:AraC family transcriptional regulator [bacterium]